MNAILKDDFFHSHVHGLVVGDVRAFAAHAGRAISDDVCFALLQIACAAFRARAYTLDQLVPPHMQSGLASDPRICMAASKSIRTDLRPILAERIAATGLGFRYSAAECLAAMIAAR